jgi:hypothetical protein
MEPYPPMRTSTKVAMLRDFTATCCIQLSLASLPTAVMFSTKSSCGTLISPGTGGNIAVSTRLYQHLDSAEYGAHLPDAHWPRRLPSVTRDCFQIVLWLHCRRCVAPNGGTFHRNLSCRRCPCKYQPGTGKSCRVHKAILKPVLKTFS